MHTECFCIIFQLEAMLSGDASLFAVFLREQNTRVLMLSLTFT